MNELAPAVAGAAGFGAGTLAARFQYVLYREPEFRARAQGRKGLFLRVGLGVACALAVALSFRPGHYDIGPAFLTALFAVGFLVLASTDIERRRIPNRLSYPMMLAALAVCWAWPDRSISDIFLGAGFGLAVGALLFAAGLVLGGALGMGDAKLMVLIGLVVGWPGVMYALFYGMLFAGVPSLYLVLRGRGRSYYSYGPFLVDGALIPLLFPM
jgi:Flp pilus assembly protein protease CpaA